MLERLAGRAHAPSECGAGCGYAAVGPDGTVYACHREGPSRIGHLDSGIHEAARAAWADNRLYARRGCMECWARWLCGGGCRIDSLERSGDISVPEAASCVFKRTFAEEAVWLISELTEEELGRALMSPRPGRERRCAGKTPVRA
jgi:uncharacterized protein